MGQKEVVLRKSHLFSEVFGCWSKHLKMWFFLLCINFSFLKPYNHYSVNTRRNLFIPEKHLKHPELIQPLLFFSFWGKIALLISSAFVSKVAIHFWLKKKTITSSLYTRHKYWFSFWCAILWSFEPSILQLSEMEYLFSRLLSLKKL